MIMDDKLKGHIQCLIENVGLNATRHKNQELAIKEAKEVMEEIEKNCSIPDVVVSLCAECDQEPVKKEGDWCVDCLEADEEKWDAIENDDFC